MAVYPKKELFSIYDISQICKIDIPTVKSWLDQKKIPFFETPGNHRRIRFSELEKFMQEQNIQRPENWNGPFDKWRILLVEDDPDLLEIIGELLKDEIHYEVRVEDNGFSAALQIAHWHPDIILLDFVMPGMNGFEVCRRLRENPETADTPVLAMTSLSTHESKQAVMKSGVSDFLGKPFYSEKLMQKVKQHLGLEVVVPVSKPTHIS